MDSKWDKKYNTPDFVYGKNPNSFLVENISRITSGKNILSLGEGEGRNAIFLLKNGFQVTAIDQSQIGLKKASSWAKDLNFSLKTICDDLKNHPKEVSYWDAIVNIFAHTYPPIRKLLHKRIEQALKIGGVYILEAYTIEQLKYDTGGPQEEELFMSLSLLREELPHLHFEIGREIIKDVREGIMHTGQSSVVQIVARKLK